MSSLPVDGGVVPQARREVTRRGRWAGGVKRGSELGVVLTGTSGLQGRNVYTGQRSARSPYIAERAQSMHGLTRGEMLQVYYKDRDGLRAPYQERDLRYDIAQGYLQKEGGGLVVKRGALQGAGGRWALARGGGAGLG